MINRHIAAFLFRIPVLPSRGALSSESWLKFSCECEILDMLDVVMRVEMGGVETGDVPLFPLEEGHPVC